MSSPTDIPVPDLEPRPVSSEEFWRLIPEKLELLSGYVGAPEERRRLLALLLVNVGLLESVKLAPETSWRKALERVYGA